MLLEIAKPVALLLCILSLYAVFHVTFLVPNASELLISDAAQSARILHALLLFSLSTGICLISGLLFQESEPLPRPRLIATLPVQLLAWSAGLMLLLYIASWYLETHFILYPPIVHW